VHCAVVYVCGLDIMLLNLNLFEPLSLYCLPSVGGRVHFNTKKVPIIMMISRCIFLCVFNARVFLCILLKNTKHTQKIQPHFEKQPKFELTIK
jgi:hypothetical protein